MRLVHLPLILLPAVALACIAQPLLVDAMDYAQHPGNDYRMQAAINRDLKPGSSVQEGINWLHKHGFQKVIPGDFIETHYDSRHPERSAVDAYYRKAGTDHCGPYDLNANLFFENGRLIRADTLRAGALDDYACVRDSFYIP